MLQLENDGEEERTESSERHKARRVLAPRHRVCWIHTCHPVNRLLERPQTGIKPRVLARKNARHVRARRRYKRGHERDKERIVEHVRKADSAVPARDTETIVARRFPRPSQRSQHTL